MFIALFVLSFANWHRIVPHEMFMVFTQIDKVVTIYNQRFKRLICCTGLGNGGYVVMPKEYHFDIDDYFLS